MAALKDVLTNIQPLTEQEWTIFLSIVEYKTLQKGEYFLQEGQVCQYSAYIESGILRHFIYDTKGNEKIAHFSVENDFVSDCESYIYQAPAKYYIQAIETSNIIAFKNTHLQNLSNRYPVFEKVGKHITAKILAEYKEHLHIMMNFSPDEKYEFLQKNKPHLLLQLSVTHLSQYLSLARETVSRLRAKILLK